MQFHPAANIFPMMGEAEFGQLVADIETHGQREPVITFDGLILDGRNRFRALEQLGWPPVTREWDGQGDPVAFVVSLNLHRRHLSESQRAMVAAKIATMGQGARTDLAPIGATSQSDAAEMLNVGRRTVQRAAEVIDHGVPELAAEVEAGRVAVSAASAVATLPPDEQAMIVARGEKEILAAAKKIRNEKTENRRQERFDTLAKIARGNADLPGGGAARFPVIYADPPWRYEHVMDDADAIENHYPTMPLAEICALPVEDMATPDAILFLWVTSPKLEEAMSVINSWGFTYRTSMVWFKSGLGMGYWARINHELLLIATRGEMPAPAPANRPASVVELPKGAHSAKPAEFAEMIERMFPDLPRVEMFCRSPREGWAVWGNQSASVAAGA